MSLTTSVKDELNKKQLRNPSARMAELITLLRFAGGLRLKNGQLFMEIDLDHELTANAIRKLVHSIFGINSIATVVPPTAIRKTTSIRIEISI
jgi:DNA-binding protein WhiA